MQVLTQASRPTDSASWSAVALQREKCQVLLSIINTYKF